MKRLIALLLIMVPVSLGCSGNKNVTVICEGTPASGAIWLNKSNTTSPYYEVKSLADGHVYDIPVQQCILVQQEEIK